MEKGTVIGKGRTAEVYEWGEGKVLKLYFDWYNEEWINFEKEIGYALAENGVPSPKVYGLIDEGSRKGIIYERVSGKSILKLLGIRPWKGRYYCRRMAQVHNEIHNFNVEKLPKQKPHIEHAIRQSEALLGDRTEKIIKYLYELPDGSSVCHGDFHPDNIIIDGENSTVIDWTNSYCGNPLGDTARTLLMFESTYMPPETSKIAAAFSGMIRKSLCSAYLKEYMKLSKVKREDIEEWMLPIAAARLRENVPGEKEWLLNIIDRALVQAGL